MREAVELTKVFDRDAVDRALGQAAIAIRFTTANLLSILTTRHRQPQPRRIGDPLAATRHRRLGSHRDHPHRQRGVIVRPAYAPRRFSLGHVAMRGTH